MYSVVAWATSTKPKLICISPWGTPNRPWMELPYHTWNIIKKELQMSTHADFNKTSKKTRRANTQQVKLSSKQAQARATIIEALSLLFNIVQDNVSFKAHKLAPNQIIFLIFFTTSHESCSNKSRILVSQSSTYPSFLINLHNFYFLRSISWNRNCTVQKAIQKKIDCQQCLHD